TTSTVKYEVLLPPTKYKYINVEIFKHPRNQYRTFHIKSRGQTVVKVLPFSNIDEDDILSCLHNKVRILGQLTGYRPTSGPILPPVDENPWGYDGVLQAAAIFIDEQAVDGHPHDATDVNEEIIHVGENQDAIDVVQDVPNPQHDDGVIENEVEVLADQVREEVQSESDEEMGTDDESVGSDEVKGPVSNPNYDMAKKDSSSSAGVGPAALTHVFSEASTIVPDDFDNSHNNEKTNLDHKTSLQLRDPTSYLTNFPTNKNVTSTHIIKKSSNNQVNLMTAMVSNATITSCKGLAQIDNITTTTRTTNETTSTKIPTYVVATTLGTPQYAFLLETKPMTEIEDGNSTTVPPPTISVPNNTIQTSVDETPTRKSGFKKFVHDGKRFFTKVKTFFKSIDVPQTQTHNFSEAEFCLLCLNSGSRNGSKLTLLKNCAIIHY
ncbi:hypothetical protein HDU76_002166, partial [Blyttiomyces sp. JEL0837]